jgi:hypothetical protein
MVLSKSKDQKMNELIRSKMKPGKSNNPIKKDPKSKFIRPNPHE